MYKVIKINEYLATRTVELENQITGNRDICFDDSALVSMKNFEFMKVGESYDCLILLVGDITDEGNQKAVRCKIISDELIGNRNCLKVLVDKEIYYVSKYKVQNKTNDDFLFTYYRKDLIKVNEVIHDDLLR